MKFSDFLRCALGFCVAVAILAGCGGGSGTPLSPSPAGVDGGANAPASRVQRALQFQRRIGRRRRPARGPPQRQGHALRHDRIRGRKLHEVGCGTVFAITTSGAETVLHSFEGGSETVHTRRRASSTSTARSTARPMEGAQDGDGTVFAITTSGKETVLHSFGGDSRRLHIRLRASSTSRARSTARPMTGARTATERSSRSRPSGKETVLHSFGRRLETVHTRMRASSTSTARSTARPLGGAQKRRRNSLRNHDVRHGNRAPQLQRRPGDGEYPYAGLINVNGTLYGTTYFGGANDDGTVFSITTSGKETVLHSFGSAGRRRIPLCGPHQRQRYALRHDL